MRKLKIVLAATVPDTFAFILAGQPKFLAGAFDLTLLTSFGRYSALLERETVPIVFAPMIRHINPLRDILAFFRLIRIFRSIRPDIVHSYTPKAGLLCMSAAFFCRIPIRVHTFTGLVWPTSLGPTKWLLAGTDALTCACATDVVAEGQGVLRDLKRLPLFSKSVRVIGNGNIAGVDVDHFDRMAQGVAQSTALLRKKYRFKGDTFVFVFLGRLHKDKGLQELIEAFLDLTHRARLLIVGELDSNGPIESTLWAKIRGDSRILLAGFHFDVRPALCASNILVLPSYREGFPNALLQAGALKLPVIASDICGSNEIIQQGVNGWLVPARDSRSLRISMQEAMSTPRERLDAMGEVARQRVVNLFDRKSHWDRMRDFYNGLGNTLHYE